MVSSVEGKRSFTNGTMSIQNANITGDVQLDFARCTALTLGGATVRGSISVKGQLQNIAASQTSVDGSMLIGCKNLFTCSLIGAKISGTLIVSDSDFVDSYIYQPRGIIRSGLLRCYRSSVYVELVSSLDNNPSCSVASFLVFLENSDLDYGCKDLTARQIKRIVFLDGTSNPLHKLNEEKPSPLILETEEQAREYLLLFCASVWGEEGSFAILLKDEALPNLLAKDVALDPIRLSIPLNKEEGDRWRARAYVRYAGQIFEAEFWVHDSGCVEMVDDKPFAKYDKDDIVILGFSRSYRWVNLENLHRYRSDFLGKRLFEPFTKGTIETVSPYLSILLRSVSFWPAAYLNTASCKQIDDWTPESAQRASGPAAYKLVWPTLTQMQEFDYRQLPEEEHELSDRIAWVRRFAPKPESGRQAVLLLILTLLLLLGAAIIGLFVTLHLRWLNQEHFNNESSERFCLKFVSMFSLVVIVGMVALMSWRQRENKITWLSALRRGFDTIRSANVIVKFKEHWLANQPRRIIELVWAIFYTFFSQTLRAIKTRLWTPQASSFLAQPYAHLAMVFRERGEDDSAREVEAEKMWQEAVHRGRLSFRHWLAKHLLWRPYRVMFNFGLSSARALITILIFWCVGWASTFLLSDQRMLRASVTKTASAMLLKDGESPKSAFDGIYRIETKASKSDSKEQLAKAASDQQKQAEEAAFLKDKQDSLADYSCEEDIEPALYSFELMTPVINLHQESRCEIRSKPRGIDGKTPAIRVNLGSKHHFNLPLLFSYGWLWEYAKALYMLVGSIIISLAILTFSGIARRWEH